MQLPHSMGSSRSTSLLLLAWTFLVLSGCQVGVSEKLVGKWQGDCKLLIGNFDRSEVEFKSDRTFQMTPIRFLGTVTGMSNPMAADGPCAGTWAVEGNKLKLTLNEINGKSIPEFKTQMKEALTLMSGAFKQMGDDFKKMSKDLEKGVKPTDSTSNESEESRLNSISKDSGDKEIAAFLARFDEPVILTLSDDLKTATLDTTNGQYAGMPDAQLNLHKE